jgi:hypothetical protein
VVLELDAVRRLAVDVAQDVNPALEVIAVTNGQGSDAYTEILLRREADGDAALMMISVARDASERIVRFMLEREMLKLYA